MQNLFLALETLFWEMQNNKFVKLKPTEEINYISLEILRGGQSVFLFQGIS